LWINQPPLTPADFPRSALHLKSLRAKNAKARHVRQITMLTWNC
jgi:hypothetical protein